MWRGLGITAVPLDAENTLVTVPATEHRGERVVTLRRDEVGVWVWGIRAHVVDGRLLSEVHWSSVLPRGHCLFYGDVADQASG